MPEAPPTTCPEPVPGIDWRKLTLTPREGFLLSRIDGGTPPRLLADVCAMPLDDVLAALGRLVEAGAIRWSGAGGGSGAVAAAPAPPPARPAAADPGAPMEGRADARPGEPAVADDDPALSEPCELGVDERRVILGVDRRLDSLTHWVLLELHGSPTAADVKRAYFAQSRRFHPDRFFGKQLGSFKARLERIFKAIRAAYEVLGDDVLRARYAVEYPPPAAPVTIDGSPPVGAAAPARPSEEDLERQRQRILEARKKAGAGARFSHEQAERLRAHALELLGRGDAAGAAEELRRACTHEPENPELRRLLDDAHAKAEAARVKALVAEAEAAAQAEPLLAAERLAQASGLAPGEVGYAVRAAELFLAAREGERAWTIVQTALARSPRRRDVRMIAARVLEDRGDLQAALLQLETVASWEGADPHLAGLIERLTRAVR